MVIDVEEAFRSVMSENVAVTSSYQPSAASLDFRARIARTISPLRRVTPKVPFWKLGAHRIPVLWSLYRGLLRAAPTPDIRWKIGQYFQKSRHLTSPEKTRVKLQKAHKWLEFFQRAQHGDKRAQDVLQRYSSMIVVRREKSKFSAMLSEALAEREKLLNRPFVKGYFRPTLYNGPLPRLVPQPLHITGMINKRKKNRMKRQERFVANSELMKDIRREAFIEQTLAKSTNQKLEGAFDENLNDWLRHHTSYQKAMFRSFTLEVKRISMQFPPALVAQIEKARKERGRNKMNEHRRELRGEILMHTIQRRRKAPPSHILERMSPLRRHLDRVARSNVSEVGYVGWAKKKLGYKLRDPDAWKVEIGKDEDQPRLNAMEEEIRRENERRRTECDQHREPGQDLTS